MTADQPLGKPEAMRAAMRGYVAALHHAYLGAAALLPPGERAALPLMRAGQFTVVIAAARHLHLLATADPLPLPAGQEVQEDDAEGDLAWSVRFYDPVVLPALALVEEAGAPAPGDVRRVIGVTDVIYHLSVSPGGAWPRTTLSTRARGWPTSTRPPSATRTLSGRPCAAGKPWSTSSRPPSGSACTTRYACSPRPSRPVTRTWPAPRPAMTTRRSGAPWSCRPAPGGGRGHDRDPAGRRDSAARQRAQRRPAAPGVRPR